MKDNSLKNIKEKKSLFTQIARRLMQSLKFYEWHEFATGQEETWQQIEMRIQMYERVRMRKLLLYTASAAASLALLLGGSYLWLSQPEKTSTSLMARIVETPLPETSEKEILLITADDKKLNIENNVNVKYHQNGTITLNEKRVNQSPPQTEEYNQVIVPKGKRTNIIFADGTRIYVNSGSRVVYPTVFAKDKREIYVEGEVYLDVKRDENCPFFVKTNDLSIKVLGTSFNVCAYKEDAEATVVLVKGKVEVETKANSKVTLCPNELFRLKDLSVETCKVDASEYICWTESLMMFEHESLDKVLTRLSRYYGCEIKYEKVLGQITISGKLDLRDSIEEVVGIIASTAPIALTYTNNLIEVKMKETK